jgi:hypothetical protein
VRIIDPETPAADLDYVSRGSPRRLVKDLGDDDGVWIQAMNYPPGDTLVMNP